MNTKKIIRRMFLLIVILVNVSIISYAKVPTKISYFKGTPLNGSCELTWNQVNQSTYIIKRAETKSGNYKIIAEDIVDRNYVDNGLENAKTYYYKVCAKNSDGVGEESDVIEVTPTESLYLLVKINGFDSYIKNLKIYDIDDKEVYYSAIDNNSRVNNVSNHYGWIFNNSCASRAETINPYVLRLHLNPHKGIKKISFEGHSDKVVFYKSMDSNLYTNKHIEFGEICSGKDRYVRYELFDSGLQAKGGDKKVSLNWNDIDNVKNYRIKRSESINGTYKLIAKDITNNNYIDTTVENKKTYYYKVEAIESSGEILDLGTVLAETSKVRYLIMEMIGNEEYPRLHKMELLDEYNSVINYKYIQNASYMSDVNINIERRTYKYSNRFELVELYDDRMDTYFCCSNAHEDKWCRYAFLVDANTDINKINLWTKEYVPKEVTFYTCSDYDYKNNMILRRDDELSFFDNKGLEASDQMKKYEFTQSKPNAPKGINAISQDSRVRITWNRVGNADSYNIKRSTSPSGPYTLIEEDITDLEYTDIGIVNKTEYYYVVSAVNRGGESDNSSEVFSMPIAQLPQEPTEIKVISREDGLTLSWSPVYNATSYTVKRSDISGGPYETIIENTTDTSLVDSGLTFGITYYYVIIAHNDKGSSNYSEEVQGLPGRELPEQPANIITQVNNDNVYITWDTVNHAVSFNVMRSETKEGTYELINNVEGISYRDTSVESDNIYYYKIIAVNEQGESEESKTVKVTMKNKVEKIVVLSITMKNGLTKDYIITYAQLTQFMNWYQERTINKGLPYFTLISNNNYGTYKSNKKYILFDSILGIDVKEIQNN